MTLQQELIQTVEMSGDTSPGNWNFAASLIEICANDGYRWTRRADDALRFPAALEEAAEVLRAKSRRQEPQDE